MKTLASLITLILISSTSFAQHSYLLPGNHKVRAHHYATAHVHGEACFQKQVREWVPGKYQQRWTPAQYRTVQVRDPYSGCLVQKQIVDPAGYKSVFVPGHYNTKSVWVCKPVYRSTPTYTTPSYRHSNDFRYSNNYNHLNDSRYSNNYRTYNTPRSSYHNQFRSKRFDSRRNRTYRRNHGSSFELNLNF